MKLIIGLGNPGKEYADTRHNAGFMALESLARTCNFPDFKLDKKFSSEITSGMIGADKILLVKPQTFMNESGVAARALFDFYKLTLDDLLVIHDDKDIELGKYRLQSNRTSAGHNGVQSLIDNFGTNNFTRIRIGIATPLLKSHDTANFVLENFNQEEKKILATLIKKLSDLIIPAFLELTS